MLSAWPLVNAGLKRCAKPPPRRSLQVIPAAANLALPASPHWQLMLFEKAHLHQP
jgi:hypothetical protein